MSWRNLLATPTIANALDDVAFEGVLSGLVQIVPAPAASAERSVREIAARRGD
jgi:hypothetical protein